MTTLFDSNGLTVDLADDIKTNLEGQAQEAFGDDINIAPGSFFGHTIEHFARILGYTNQALQALWSSLCVQNSSGVPLDCLVSLVGLYRQSDAYTTAVLTLTSNKATTVTTGSLYSTSSGLIFSTDEDLVFAGAGSDTVSATCTIPGDFSLPAGSITQKVSTVYGITGVDNLVATTPGRYRETDPEVKNKHIIATATSGQSDINTMYEALLGVDGVSGVYVDENDDIGQIAVYLIGGDDVDIATAINNNRTAGVKTYGSSSYSVYSEETNISKTIYWTDGSEVDIYIAMNISAISGLFPNDGEDQIKNSIESEFSDLKMYQSVVYSRLYKAIYQVQGVIINSLYIGTTASPSGTTDINILKSQRASVSADNVTISVL